MKKVNSKYFKLISLVFFVLMSGPLSAQTIAQNVLDDILISSSNYTGIVKILFRLPVRYISHYPLQKGKEIRIKVNVIKSGNITQNNRYFKESLVPQYDESYGLEEVYYDNTSDGEYIVLFFDKKVSFEIIQDSSYRSISVVVHEVK